MAREIVTKTTCDYPGCGESTLTVWMLRRSDGWDRTRTDLGNDKLKLEDWCPAHAAIGRT